MGGFGFGMLADVRMLGYYQAQHPQTHRAFLAYVLQVTTTLGHRFLVYRRYSQIAALAAKLRFIPSVGLPPKYALQVFPLTEEQLQQRYDGLRAFLTDVFAALTRMHDEGLQHDVQSTAGMDLQVFYDFVAHQRNRPPMPVTALPEWATPRSAGVMEASMSEEEDGFSVGTSASLSLSVPSSTPLSTAAAMEHDQVRESRSSSSCASEETEGVHVPRRTWQDVESLGSESLGSGEVHESPDASGLVGNGNGSGSGNDSRTSKGNGVGDGEGEGEGASAILNGEELSNQFRNEILQAEGTLNAFWNCVLAYERATQAWWSSLGAVVSEYERITDMPLFNTTRTRDGASVLATEDQLTLKPQRLVQSYQQLHEGIEAEFDTSCEREVMRPMETLVSEVLPEIKHSYWTRLSNMQSVHDSAPNTVNPRRLLQERETLHERIRSDAQTSMKALLKLQERVLSEMLVSFEEFHAECGQSSLANAFSMGPISSNTRGEQERGENDEDDDGNLESSRLELSDLVANSQRTEDGEINNVEPVAVDRDGVDEAEQEPTSLWIWGRPPKKESGTPLLLRPKKMTILPGQHIVEIACGGEHLLYLTHTGDVYTFGDDSEDRKMNSSTVHSSSPASVGGSVPTTSFTMPRLVEEFALEKALHQTKIVQIACGAQHSVGITDAGEVYTWGSGEDGRLGHGDMRDRAVPRKIMSLLRHRVLQASCGGAHTAVLTDHGSVFTFGRGRNGRLGLGDAKWRDTPQQVSGFGASTAIAQVVCGWNFTVSRALDGRVFSWGKQGEGQCGLGYVDKDQMVPRVVDTLQEIRIVDIACGYTHTLALTSRGAVYSWGLGEYGQLGRGIVYQPVPDIVDFSDVLCSPDQVQRVYCGAFHSVVTTNSRVMFAWGLNLYGACGLGHTVNKDTPERIDCFQPTKDLVVACGHKYTIAVEVDPQLREALLTPDEAVDSTTRAAAQRLLEAASTRLQVSVAEAILAPDWSHTLMISNGVVSPPSASPSRPPRDTIHNKEEELRRAKKMWRTRILRDWEESKDTPLAHSMWRQGIPPTIRARVWPLAIGNKLKITPHMYQIYRKRATTYKQERTLAASSHGVSSLNSPCRMSSGDEASSILMGKEHTLALIDTDLPRTFPSLKLFDSSGPYYEYLLEVLETYACYRPDLGYIQGMSYLAALLCLHMPQDRYLAFQCLANLMVNEHLFTFYLLDADLSAVYYALFDEFLAARSPALHHHLQNIGVRGAMYLMNWLQTLFLQVLPLEIAARVVDNFLLDGTVFLFRTALAIHELLGEDLLGAEIEEAMPILQRGHIYHDLWLTRVTEDSLFARIAQISVPMHIYSALGRVINDVFFFDKRNGEMSAGDVAAATSGGQSVGIGRVKTERRRMYSIGDTLNGVLGGF